LVRLLRYRPRSVAEARKRLRAQGFSVEAVEEVLRRAEAAGLLDDALFARLWVGDRLLYHPLSRRAVKRELTEKGISSETSEQVMEDLYPPEKEKPLALELAQARLERYRGLGQQRRMRRTIAYLTRRGFAFSLASHVVRMLVEELSDRESGELSD